MITHSRTVQQTRYKRTVYRRGSRPGKGEPRGREAGLGGGFRHWRTLSARHTIRPRPHHHGQIQSAVCLWHNLEPDVLTRGPVLFAYLLMDMQARQSRCGSDLTNARKKISERRQNFLLILDYSFFASLLVLRKPPSIAQTYFHQCAAAS